MERLTRFTRLHVGRRFRFADGEYAGEWIKRDGWTARRVGWEADRLGSVILYPDIESEVVELLPRLWRRCPVTGMVAP